MSAVNPRRDSKTRTRMIHWLLVDFFFFFPVEHDKSQGHEKLVQCSAPPGWSTGVCAQSLDQNLILIFFNMNVFLKVIRKLSSFTNKNRRSQNTGVKSEETDGTRHVHRQVCLHVPSEDTAQSRDNFTYTNTRPSRCHHTIFSRVAAQSYVM